MSSKLETTTASKAVFMTASEIHGRLKVVGNIEKLMPINKFGQLLQRRGYRQTFHDGIRGYIVVENVTPMQSQKEIAKQLLNTEVF